MGFRWPFGKKQAAFRQMQRDDLEASMNAYADHLARMVALFEPTVARLDEYPAVLHGDARQAIEDHVEKDLPALRSMLSEMQTAEPHRIIQTRHQKLLTGLELVVHGEEHMLAAVQTGAGQSAESDYRRGVDMMREGFSTALSSMKEIDVVVAEARRLLG